MMDVLVNHIGDYQGLYVTLLVMILLIGGLRTFDVITARRYRVTPTDDTAPDHTRVVQTHHPWAGMDESGPDTL